MADVTETLARERKWLDGGLGMTQRTQHKLLSAVENVLVLCDKALAVKVTRASEGDVAMAAMAAQVHKAITDALGASDE